MSPASAPSVRPLPLLLLLTACGSGGASASPFDSPDGLPAPAQSDQGLAPPPMAQPGATPAPTLPDEPGPVCSTVEAVARPVEPQVLIVLDRSGSMAGERWNRSIGAVQGLVEDLQSKVHFGLAMYPGVGEELDCRGGPVRVQPAMQNADDIETILQAQESEARTDFGYTPTALTLGVALDQLTTVAPDDASEPQYVLLVTDGKPNCLVGAEKWQGDEEATYASIDALRDADIKTYVIGYLTQEFASIMDTMAQHGGTDRHYPVEDETTLRAALDQITNSVVSCGFALEQVPAGPEYVRVLLDGEEIDLGPDGWTHPQDTTIELGGAACSRLRDGGVHQLQILIECDPVRVI